MGIHSTSYLNPHITFGYQPHNDYQIIDIRLDSKTNNSHCKVKYHQTYNHLSLPMLGKQHLLNAIPAWIILHHPWFGHRKSPHKITSYLQKYQGIHLRGTTYETSHGGKIIYDYSHHPTEVSACLEALISYQKPIICFFQPHLLSRTEKYCHVYAQILAKYTTKSYIITCDLSRELGSSSIAQHLSEQLCNQINHLGTPANHLATKENIQLYFKNHQQQNTIIIVMGSIKIHELLSSRAGQII